MITARERWAKGAFPWAPFKLVTTWPLPERNITDATLGLLQYVKFESNGARTKAISEAISVLVASRAINKMMGKPEGQGMYTLGTGS